MLSLLQKDKIAFKTSFNKDFIDLENQITDLEEKNDMLTQNKVNLFDAGTTYASEKARIKEQIDAKVNLHKSFITNFENNYLTKNADFLSNYQQYENVNKDLLTTINSNIAKVEAVLKAFAEMDNIVTKIHGKLTGLDDLISKMDDTKTKGVSTMDQRIQALITTDLAKYLKLQSLASELNKQKIYILGQFQLDVDEYMTKNLQSRYDRAAYLSLKSDVERYKAKYYSGASLNCVNALSSSNEGSGLLAKIASMKISLNS